MFWCILKKAMKKIYEYFSSKRARETLDISKHDSVN